MRDPGVLRFVIKTYGEVISEAIPDSALHLSTKRCERVTYHGCYSDRVDYLAAMFAIRVLHGEKIAGTEVSCAAKFAA